MKKLAAYTVTNVAVYGALVAVDKQVDADQIVANTIITASVLAIIVPLVWTPKWRILSLGLLGLFTGLLVAYIPRTHWGDGWVDRDANGLLPLWYLRIFRTCWIVGGVVIAVFLLQWAYKYRRRAFPWFRRSYRHDDPDLLTLPRRDQEARP